MSEIKYSGLRLRWVKHHHKGVDIRIALDGEKGSVPAGAKIISENNDGCITWRSLESTSLTEAVAEAKNYADQWVDQGMPGSVHESISDLEL